MVLANNCTQLILKEFPLFSESSYWKKHLEDWCEGELFYLEIAAFGRYVRDLINEGISLIERKKIFDFIEMLMINGDSEVQNAIATCFLENLLNYYSAGDIDALKFTPLLGPESRAYCKAWDEFTGVTTPGV